MTRTVGCAVAQLHPGYGLSAKEEGRKLGRLRRVEVWPATGFADQPWLEDPAEDAFAKSSRRVCELIERRLSEVMLPTRDSMVRFYLSSDEDAQAALGDGVILVSPWLEPSSDWETCNVLVSRWFLDLAPADRARVVFDVVEAALRRYAQTFDWDTAALEQVLGPVRNSDLRYQWAGAWKSSPSRRLRARCVAELFDDGFGRMSVEVEDSRSSALIGVSQPSLSYSTSKGFARSAKSMRWASEESLEFEPFIPFFPSRPVPQEIAIPDDLVARSDSDRDVLGPVGGGTSWRVEIQGRGRLAHEQGHELKVVGGGPANGVPGRYSNELDRQLANLETEPFRAWWSHSPVMLGEVFYKFDAAKVGVRVGVGEVVTATIDRPVGTIRDSEPTQLARADFRAMLDRLSDRLGLPPAPELH